MCHYTIRKIQGDVCSLQAPVTSTSGINKTMVTVEKLSEKGNTAGSAGSFFTLSTFPLGGRGGFFFLHCCQPLQISNQAVRDSSSRP